VSGIRFSRALFLRSIAGLAIGAAIGAALTDLGAMAVALVISGYGSWSPESLPAMLGSGLGYGAIRGILLVLPTAVIVCWPLHLILLRLGWRSIFIYAPMWAAAMLAAYLVTPYYGGNVSTGWLVAAPLSTGLIAGTVFWLIRRPDRDTA